MGVGATVAAAYWIYTLQAPAAGGFWQVPGFASVAVGAVGFVMLVIGLFGGDKATTPRQVQRGGDNSTNIQAGGDIRIEQRGGDRQ
jgi:hypothetical protein